MTDSHTHPIHRDDTGRRRVLLKLSGEVFGGGEVGISTGVVRNIAQQIAATVGKVETSIVIGGGNFFRGAELSQAGMDRSRADYMGMLGTVMNSLALQDFLEQEGIDTRVQSAITMPQVAETYIPRRAIRHMQKDRVVIFGAGAGLPYFSTDTVAAQRALEIQAERLYNLTYDEAMQRNIRVLDQTAFSLCRDNNVTMRVFGMQGEGNVTRAILGEKMGTLVTR